MKFCPFCGSELGGQVKFCPNCGKNVQESMPNPNTNTAFTQQQPPPITSMPNIGSSPSIPSYSASTSSPMPPYQTNPIKFASGGDRVIAFIIDSIIWGIVIELIFRVDFSANNIYVKVLQMLLSFFYFWGCETLAKGQTLGKMLLKIRTVDDVTFQPVSTGRYALHALGKAAFMLIDLIIGLISKNQADPVDNNRIRATQKISHTVVIKIN
jgi:hypothetical protein